jgi:hypothetical protein
MLRIITFLSIVFISYSCTNKSSSISTKQAEVVKDSVNTMMKFIAKDITASGTSAWLKYFENTPAFFMASDGNLVFPSHDLAEYYINKNIKKSISKIGLQWGDIKIDPLTANYANIAATFHEEITDASGTSVPLNGFFTGIAHQNDAGWQLHNAHWSVSSN